MRHSLIIAIVLGGATLQAWSNPPAPASQPASLADLLEPIRAKYKTPALGGAVVRGDELVAIGAVGARKSGDKAPVTIKDRFHIGSCTKAMTATMLGMLVEQGKLKWSTTIGEVFPELKVKMRPEYAGVTLDQLLTHRSGIPADLIPSGVWTKLWEFKGAPKDARVLLLEGALPLQPDAPPNTRFIYSNTGYAVAGAIAERITGQSWENLMRKMLFKPLAMKSAGFGAPGKASQVDQPYGHVYRNGAIEPVPPGPAGDNPPAIAPAGAVHCSLADWGKFVSVHLNGTKASRLLKPETIRKLHTPPPGQDYALGWGVTKQDWAGKGPMLAHAGSNTMWYCLVWAAPEKGIAVLVATNEAGELAPKACDEAAYAIIQQFLAGDGSKLPPP